MGGTAGSRDAGRLVAAPFLVKTYRLVDDPSTEHIVSWGENNNSFVVWRPKDFSASVLPNYFNHSNFSSFVRQLNTYGFRKIVRGRYEFANELFKKEHEHLLSHIQRRKPSNTSIMQAPHMEYEKSSSLSAPISSTRDSDVPAAAASLSEENETLRKSNSFLLSEIARLQNICSNDITQERSTWTDRCLIEMESSKMDNASASSSMTDVAEEIGTSPPKLFGFPLR